MTPQEETARIIMPQSGVGATPQKGLIREHNEYPGGRTIPGILNKIHNING